MSVFKRLAAQGKIKELPKTTATECKVCGNRLKDFEAMYGGICSKCVTLEKVKAKEDGTCMGGTMGYKLHEDGINNKNVSDDLPF